MWLRNSMPGQAKDRRRISSAMMKRDEEMSYMKMAAAKACVEIDVMLSQCGGGQKKLFIRRRNVSGRKKWKIYDRTAEDPDISDVSSGRDQWLSGGDVLSRWLFCLCCGNRLFGGLGPCCGILYYDRKALLVLWRSACALYLERKPSYPGSLGAV